MGTVSHSDDSLNENNDVSPIPFDVENADDELRLVHTASRATHDNASIERLESLSRVLSTRKFVDGKFQLNPEHFDLEAMLKTLRNKMNNEGEEFKATGVMFRELGAEGKSNDAAEGPSVGQVLRAPAALFHKSKPNRMIISGFNGVVEAGEMLLVLGRPGAGASTLLKTLAGETDSFTGVEGEVSYDGATQDEMKKHFKGDVIYNGEMDNHFAHITVDQTLGFAVACRTPSNRLTGKSRGEYQSVLLEVLKTVFGLRHTSNTKVGNDYVRGVSGGERKRVSIAEALASRSSVYCWDNATRGLDASTALEYAHAIRAMTNILGNVGIVAIYQAGENIYDLFDKVTVIYKGRQVFFGSATRAKAYFEEMGYECPPRQTTAEFLTAVTDPQGRFVREGVTNVPQTSAEFEDYWRKSSDYANLIAEMDKYAAEHDGKQTIARFNAINEQMKMKHQRKNSRYMITYYAQMKLLIRRGYDRIVGDIAFTITSIVGSIIQALIAGSLFYNLGNNTTAAFSRGGVMFFALLSMALSELASIATLFENRKIVLKQKSYSFYHPSGETLQDVFTRLPLKVLTCAAFVLVLYFLTNLKRDAGTFFQFYLIILLATLCISSLFGMIASLTPTSAVANSIAGLFVLMIVVNSGYMLPAPTMHPWFSWLNWLNPAYYSFEAIMSSGFHGVEMACNLMVPRGGAYDDVAFPHKVCAFVGATANSTTVLGDNYVYETYKYKYDHFWRNFGIVIGFWCFFVGVQTVATEFVKPPGGSGDLLLFKRGAIPENLDEEKDDELFHVDAVDKSELAARDIFSWQHVDYTIPLGGGTRKLLDDVQGYVKPGTLTALMGESGAGKTTLLNVLSQRINFGVITGDMLVNGRPLDQSFKRRTGYVQQQDIHLATATVRESLQFSARLRQPSNVPEAEKMEYVEKVIDLLHMRDYADAYVGDAGFGLNVEQRKKLSIGVELAAKPALLLFLDEPTSGLDSQSAWAIVQFLKELAAAGQALLVTIHQPSATLFEEFDRLLLLKKGGRCVYFGDIGKNSKTLTDYFKRNGARECTPSENPAEYILEAIGAGATASVDQDWGDVWARSPEFQQVTHEIQELNRELASRPITEQPEFMKRTYAASFLTQFFRVYQRTLVMYWRTPSYILAKFVLMIVGGLFIGFTFWKINESIQGMQNAMMGMFLLTVLAAPLSNQIISHAVAGLDLYRGREEASNTFHWSLLLICQYLAEIPFHILFSTILYGCAYFTIGYFSSATYAGFFWLSYCIFFQIYYPGFALMVFYASPDEPSAAINLSLFFTMCLMFCGVLQPQTLMPRFWIFMYRCSPYTYFLENFLGTVLHKRPVVCSENEWGLLTPPAGSTCYEYLQPFMEVAGGYLREPNATDVCSYCTYSVGDEYLSTVKIAFTDRYRNLGLYCVYIAFNFIGMLALYWFFKESNISMPKFNFSKKGKKEANQKAESEKPAEGDIYKLREGDENVIEKSEGSSHTNVGIEDNTPNEKSI